MLEETRDSTSSEQDILLHSKLHQLSNMKFSTTFLYTFLAVATLGAANPTGSNDIAAENVTPVSDAVPNILEKRKGCSGDRKDTDVCGGKKLATQNSFHNW